MSFLQDKHGRYTASLRADLARRGFTDGVQELLGKKISVIFIDFMCLLISCGYVVMKKKCKCSIFQDWKQHVDFELMAIGECWEF